MGYLILLTRQTAFNAIEEPVDPGTLSLAGTPSSMLDGCLLHNMNPFFMADTLSSMAGAIFDKNGLSMFVRGSSTHIEM